MLIKFIFMVSICLVTFVSLPGQTDVLWRKILFLNDSLKQKPDAELNLLLKMEEERNQSHLKVDSSAVYLCRQIGILYLNKGEFLKAIPYFRKGIDMIRKNESSPAINPEHLLYCYYRLNTCYDSLGRISEKMEAIDSCLNIITGRKINNLYSLAAVFKKVEYLFDVGDYSACIDYATLCEGMGKQYAKLQGNNNYDVGMHYVSSSLVWNIYAQIQLQHFEEAERMLNNTLTELKGAESNYNRFSIFEQLSEIQILKKNYEKALIYLRSAYNLAYLDDRIISCKAIMNNIGHLYLQNKVNLDSALFYLLKANSLVNRDKKLDKLNSVETLNILDNIGNVYAQKEIFDSAFLYYRHALDQIKPGLREEELLYSQYDEFANQKKIGYLTGLLMDKADALLKFYKKTGEMPALKEAVHIYRVTDRLLDRIKVEQTDVQSKLFWRSDSRKLYEHGIEACYEIQNVNDAFYFFEKSRAVLLNEQLNQQRWLGEEDILKQNQLKRRVAQLTLISNGLNKDSDRYRQIQNEMLTQKQELTQLLQVIKERDPLYFQSYVDTNVTTIRDVQKSLLSDHQALIEMFSGDSAVYIFSILPTITNFRRIDKKEFDYLTGKYLFLISNSSRLNEHFNEFVQVSKNLFQQIFATLDIPQGRLIVSPDGRYFPFESMIRNDSGMSLKYLFNDYAVSYTYSAKYLMNHFSSLSNSEGHPFLGIAPVQYPGEMKLMSLKGSDHSLLKLQTNFSESNSLVYTNATRSEFLTRFSQYKIIQLYTHATDSGTYGEPQIYFSDSSLNLSDLTNDSKPVTRLVVLSACETGNGRLYRGEGIFSFNRGFAALGIPTSITNLWSIDDQSTYRMNELFYKFLTAGLPIDVALQKAKIEFYKTATRQKQLPYYWAASVIVGETDEINLRKKISRSTTAIFVSTIGLLVLMACYGYNVYKKKYPFLKN